MELINYLQDGADSQARVVLTILQHLVANGMQDNNIELGHITIATWFNGREHGYAASLSLFPAGKQLHVAWYTHRCSDSICALSWEQHLTNPPNIESAHIPNYTRADNVAQTVPFGHYKQMAKFIYEEFEMFIAKTFENRKSV